MAGESQRTCAAATSRITRNGSCQTVTTTGAAKEGEYTLQEVPPVTEEGKYTLREILPGTEEGKHNLAGDS